MIVGFISTQTLLVILVMLIFFSGGKMIPGFARALRRTASEFRKGRRDDQSRGRGNGDS